MTKQTCRFFAAFLLSIIPASAQVGLEMLNEVAERLGGADIDSKKGITFDKGALVWDGGIHLKSDMMEVFAEKAEYLLEREDLVITGDVSIYKDGLLYRGERAVYSTKTNKLDASGMRSSLEPKAPIWFQASTFESSQGEVEEIQASDMFITTEDSEDPGFHLGAKSVKIYPEDRIVFKHLKAYIGETPVFWLPYLSQPLNEEQGYIFTPGYRSNLGAFLLNQYGDTLGDHSLIKYKADFYSTRGLALGFDILSRKFKESETPNFGKFKFYWINDLSPEDSGLANTAPRTDVDENRYRVNLQHRVYLPGPKESNLYVDIDLNKMSDQYFYEDFFPWEFREDPEPDNIINIIKTHERGELSILTRMQFNDFYSTDTRLPEIALDLVKQSVGNTGLFYASNSSFGILEDKLGNADKEALSAKIDQIERLLAAEIEEEEPVDKDGKPITLDTIKRGLEKRHQKLRLEEADDLLSELKATVEESKFNRLHSYHELSYPATVAEHFTVTPKVGAGFTNYSSVSGPSPSNSSRGIFAAGLDSSFKFSKTYEDIKVPALGIDGIRHIVQPYLNWSYVNTDDQGKGFRGIDRLVPSTQPRPLDLNNYTAIDSINSWNIFRVGVSNRFQTKRDGGTYNWLTTNTYLDGFIEDPEFDRSFSNLYNDITFQPVQWMRLSLGSQIPLGGDSSFTEVNSHVTFMPRRDLELSIGNRLLRDHPFFEDSNQIDLRTYYRINDTWGVSAYGRYEAEDSTLELQQYSLHRDLNSWAMALGAVIRDNRGTSEYGLVFSLTLKDFPGVRIPIDYDPSAGAR